VVEPLLDTFLNQLFATGPVTPREAADALEGRPGFISLAKKPARARSACRERSGYSWR
jgi:hypothetical protein